MLREIKQRKQKEEKRLNELSKRLVEVEETQEAAEDRLQSLEKGLTDTKKRLTDVEGRLTATENRLGGHDTSRIWSVIIIIVILIGSAIIYNTDSDRQEEKIHALQEQINELRETVDSLPANIGAQNNLNATEIFVDAALPMEKWELYDENGNTFYYDPDCKYAISNPIFCNWSWTIGEDSKGNSVRIYRLTNGDFAYILSSFNVDLSNLN